MILLALDTATRNAGVALWQDGVLLGARQQEVTTHSEALLALIDAICKEHGVAAGALDAVVCGAGPGSFTGLRIGLATAKGLCLALDRPLVLVSSLAALAARAPDGQVLATLDAFKGEVYAGLFAVQAGRPTPLGDEAALPPEALVTRAAPHYVLGSGALKYPQLVARSRLLDEEPGPRPADVARLGAARLAAGEVAELATASPTYIRPSEAELVKARRET